MEKPRKYSSAALNRVKDRVSTEQKELVKKRMQLALKIDEARKAKRLSKSELANAMGSKNPSEATKWLSGTHNFTTDTLFKLEQVLGVSLVHCTNEKLEHVKTTVIVSIANPGAKPELKHFLDMMSHSQPQLMSYVTTEA